MSGAYCPSKNGIMPGEVFSGVGALFSRGFGPAGILSVYWTCNDNIDRHANGQLISNHRVAGQS